MKKEIFVRVLQDLREYSEAMDNLNDQGLLMHLNILGVLGPHCDEPRRTIERTLTVIGDCSSEKVAETLIDLVLNKSWMTIKNCQGIKYLDFEALYDYLYRDSSLNFFRVQDFYEIWHTILDQVDFIDKIPYQCLEYIKSQEGCQILTGIQDRLIRFAAEMLPTDRPVRDIIDELSYFMFDLDFFRSPKDFRLCIFDRDDRPIGPRGVDEVFYYLQDNYSYLD